jgi:hypothetical protein
MTLPQVFFVFYILSAGAAAQAFQRGPQWTRVNDHSQLGHQGTQTAFNVFQSNTSVCEAEEICDLCVGKCCNLCYGKCDGACYEG